MIEQNGNYFMVFSPSDRRYEYIQHETMIKHIEFFEEHELVVSATDFFVRIWDYSKVGIECIKEFQPEDYSDIIEIMEKVNENDILLATDQGEVFCYSVEELKVTQRFEISTKTKKFFHSSEFNIKYGKISDEEFVLTPTSNFETLTLYSFGNADHKNISIPCEGKNLRYNFFTNLNELSLLSVSKLRSNSVFLFQVISYQYPRTGYIKLVDLTDISEKGNIKGTIQMNWDFQGISSCRTFVQGNIEYLIILYETYGKKMFSVVDSSTFTSSKLLLDCKQFPIQNIQKNVSNFDDFLILKNRFLLVSSFHQKVPPKRSVLSSTGETIHEFYLFRIPQFIDQKNQKDVLFFDADDNKDKSDECIFECIFTFFWISKQKELCDSMVGGVNQYLRGMKVPYRRNRKKFIRRIFPTPDVCEVMLSFEGFYSVDVLRIHADFDN